MTKAYSIPASNLPRLEAEIARLNKRAGKLGLPPVLFEITGQYQEEQEDPLGFKYLATYHQCQVSGEAPKINGWKFVAVLEPVGEGMVVREVPGETCPVEFRTSDLHCDHCKTLRRRSAVFVVTCVEDGEGQKAGESRQVGRDCLADFLGHSDPEALVAAAEFLVSLDQRCSEAEDIGWGFGGGLRYEPAVSTEQFVAVVSILSRRLGYVSKAQAFGNFRQATADLAWTICLKPKDKWTEDFVRDHRLQAEEKDAEIARTALAWAQTNGPGANTYLYNLGTLAKEPCVTHKHIGYLGSVIDAYNRRRSAELEKPGAHSNFLGEVGKRQEFADLTIQMLKEQESPFGMVTMVRFLDPNGNVLMWWATGTPDAENSKIAWLEVGKRVRVKGRVKEHKVYLDTKQTILERVTLLEENPTVDTFDHKAETESCQNTTAAVVV